MPVCTHARKVSTMDVHNIIFPPHLFWFYGAEQSRSPPRQNQIPSPAKQKLKTYVASDEVLMDDAGHLAHVVPPAAGEVGEGAAGVGEGADAEHGRGFGEEHGAVEGDVRVAGADVELVGLARDQGPAVQGGDADALRDGGDFVEGVVCVNGLGWLGWVGLGSGGVASVGKDCWRG